MSNEREYLVIHRNEDEPHMYLMTAPELELMLSEAANEPEGITVLKDCPKFLHFPRKSIFVFKGKVVTPFAAQFVTKWQIP